MINWQRDEEMYVTSIGLIDEAHRLLAPLPVEQAFIVRIS
jgi:hypothetical protein